MPFPYFIRKLFQNDGAGDLLNKGIIPPSYVDTAPQTFTNDQKTQARTNIGAVSSTDNVASSSGTLVYEAGSFEGRSIAELKQKLKNFIVNSGRTVTNKVFTFSADQSFISYWNNNSGTLSGGQRWEVTVTFNAAPEQWAALLFKTYTPTALAMCVMQRGEFKDIHPISCKKWTGKFDLAAAVLTETWESSDGASWYRKWSDGWIEQGGTLTVATAQTVTFAVAFSNTNYTAMSQPVEQPTNSPADTSFLTYIKGRTATAMTIHYRNSNGNNGMTGLVSWFACGY